MGQACLVLNTSQTRSPGHRARTGRRWPSPPTPGGCRRAPRRPTSAARAMELSAGTAEQFLTDARAEAASLVVRGTSHGRRDRGDQSQRGGRGEGAARAHEGGPGGRDRLAAPDGDRSAQPDATAPDRAARIARQDPLRTTSGRSRITSGSGKSQSTTHVRRSGLEPCAACRKAPTAFYRRLWVFDRRVDLPRSSRAEAGRRALLG